MSAKVLVIRSASRLHDIIWSDIEQSEVARVSVFDDELKKIISGDIGRYIYRLLVNTQLIRLPGISDLFRRWMKRNYGLGYELIIISEGSRIYRDQYTLSIIREVNPNSTVVFFATNPLHGAVEGSRMANRVSNSYHKRVMDLVQRGVYDYGVVMCPDDAIGPKWLYYELPCSEIRADGPLDERFDIHYCGKNKGRIGLIKEMASKLVAEGCSIDFYVTEVNQEDIDLSIPIHYNVGLDPYERVRHIISSNCQLEIVDPEVNYVTLRFPECLVYGRKLVTNNAGVVQSANYRPQIVEVVSTVEDLDIDFIRSPLTDYVYKGVSSPIHLISFLFDKCGIECNFFLKAN